MSGKKLGTITQHSASKSDIKSSTKIYDLCMYAGIFCIVVSITLLLISQLTLSENADEKMPLTLIGAIALAGGCCLFAIGCSTCAKPKKCCSFSSSGLSVSQSQSPAPAPASLIGQSQDHTKIYITVAPPSNTAAQHETNTLLAPELSVIPECPTPSFTPSLTPSPTPSSIISQQKKTTKSFKAQVWKT